MSYADKTIACRDCGMDFSFTSGEQEFYAQKGFTNEPTRCPSCRQARKANGGSRSSSSSRDSYSSGGYDDRESYGSSYGRDSYSNGGGNSSGYSSGTREMHSATCASCGREAKVPFVPRGDKPVYCSDCFQQQRQTSSRASTRW
jgi:CxxC-x17-CxxC domain-containing protein